MSPKNVFVTSSVNLRRNPFGIRLGHAYPIKPPSRMNMVSLESYVDGSTLILNACMSSPRDVERQAFREAIHFALYEGGDMPGGLIMVRMVPSKRHAGFVMACPFDPVDHEECWPETLKGFFSAAQVALLTILTDTGTPQCKVRGIRLLTLPPLLHQRLKVLWADPVRYANYERHFCDLVKNRSLNQIWSMASKF